MGAATPRLAHHAGPHRLLVAALALATAGLALRAVAGTVWLFALLSVVALAGGAISNVLMPSLVKQHFDGRIGPMTAVYSTALAVGLTAAAGLTVPVGSATGGGWRGGLAFWAIFTAVAVVPWIPLLRGDRPEPGTERGMGAAQMRGSRLAWALMIFFAFQSFMAYITFGWFADYLRDAGISAATAGWMVAVLAAMSIPVSMIAPAVPQHLLRPTLAVLLLCDLVAFVGLAVAPRGGAWAWMVLAGIGSGIFPFILSLIGQRARTPETTAALSAFVQSLGYVIAGSGPILFGALHSATGSWAGSLAALFAALAITAVAGWYACRERFVDDELGGAAAVAPPARTVSPARPS
jgi:CP family cyanate transporter-like MFS transporter